jgi:TRAP-type mannitol/chloroaromatic compound transport system permease small subunit
MHGLKRILYYVDTTNEWVGRIACYGIALMMVIATIEVTARYLFNQPTIWAWDVNRQLLIACVMLGGGYTLLHQMHVKMDVVYRLLSARKQAILDIITFPFFFSFIGVLLWQGGIMAWSSLVTREVANTFWGPPLYPIRMAVPIGAFLILIEGLAVFTRAIITAIGRNKVETEAKIEH